MVNHDDPYFMHSYDHPGVILNLSPSTILTLGIEQFKWRSMARTSKIGFVDVSLPKHAKKGPKFHSWM